MERYFRVFKFMGEVIGMTMSNKVLLFPLLINVVVGMVSSIGLAVAYSKVGTATTAYIVLGVGVVFLYFVDYFNNGITVSLVYDQVTTGKAEFGSAVGNTMRSAPGILVFASISGFFDMLASYAQERDDILGKILTNILYLVWTTATYMVMPTMIIEKTGFFGAFKRAKDVMKNDPTQAGIGVVGIGVANYVIGVVCFGAATMALRALAPTSPILGAFAFYFLINVYWGLTGYLKITYFTCFYLWAKNCEKESAARVELAPAPLAATLAA